MSNTYSYSSPTVKPTTLTGTTSTIANTNKIPSECQTFPNMLEDIHKNTGNSQISISLETFFKN